VAAEIVLEVEVLMESALEAVGGKPEFGCNLDQCELLDGSDIVEEYLRFGELGLAFEHLLYMIAEPPLSISHKTYEIVVRVGRSLQLSPTTWEGLQLQLSKWDSARRFRRPRDQTDEQPWALGR